MENLHIEPTKSSPLVIFNPAKASLIINGQSYPENAFKFYEPIIKRLDDYIGNGTSRLQVELNFPYINTSSSKCLMIILDRLEEAYQQDHDISVTWYIDPENESEQECAEEFREDVTFPFQIIAANFQDKL